jgi:hypothetical protein
LIASIVGSIVSNLSDFSRRYRDQARADERAMNSAAARGI